MNFPKALSYEVNHKAFVSNRISNQIQHHIDCIKLLDFIDGRLSVKAFLTKVFFQIGWFEENGSSQAANAILKALVVALLVAQGYSRQ